MRMLFELIATKPISQIYWGSYVGIIVHFIDVEYRSKTSIEVNNVAAAADSALLNPPIQ